MSESDAANILFKSYLNESSFRSESGARQNDEVGDAVRDFIEDRQFTVASGIDSAQLEHETARIDERFETLIEKSRAKIGARKDSADRPSPYLFAKATAPLAKGELASRMLTLFEKMRGDCIGDEETLLEKAARALDIPAFCEISE